MNKHQGIDKMMQERIEKFNQLVMNLDFKNTPAGLYNGKMGLCIYFYELAYMTSEKKYSVFAEKLLNDIVPNIAENIAIDMETGLTGICIAINYLLDKGYVSGNPNSVLKNFDDKILRSLLFNRTFENDKNMNLSITLLYLSSRLQHTGLNKDERRIMQDVIIENINRIESSDTEKFTEPTFFSSTGYFTPIYLKLLQQIYKLHFYDYKIERIVKEISSHILYRYPLNKANRLLLCSEMNEIEMIFENIKGWNEHIGVLQQNLNIPQIIHEFRNKNMAFFNGLCGFYYLLRKTGHGNEYNDLFLDKISSSDIWDQLYENDNALYLPTGLYGGISGVILTYMHIFYNSGYVIFFDKVISQYV